MNPENIGGIIDAIASRLQVPAEHLMAVLVKQAPIAATVECWAIGLLVFVGLCLLVRALFFDSCDSAPLGWLGALILIAAVAIVTCDGSMILAGFYNPEYWALMKVLEAVGR